MNSTIVTEYDGTNFKLYIEYNDGTHIKIDYKDTDEILKDDKYIYYIENNQITKIFDIAKRMYLKDKSIIQDIYNNYLIEQTILKKEEKGLRLHYS